MDSERRLSNDEMAFVKRMLPHFMAGKSVEACAQAVLDDDVRLFSAFSDRSHDVVVGSYSDHTSRSCRTRTTPGDVIASEITRTVYDRLRAA